MDIGRTNLIEQRILLNNKMPFKEPYKRISPSIFQEVRKHLQELLKAEIIKESECPNSSRVVLDLRRCGYWQVGLKEDLKQ